MQEFEDFDEVNDLDHGASKRLNLGNKVHYNTTAAKPEKKLFQKLIPRGIQRRLANLSQHSLKIVR